MKDFALFFTIQFVNYALICLNMRAVAQAWIGTLVGTDLAISFLAFAVIKKIAEAKSRAALAGYVTGGACGSVLSVWASRRVFGS